MPSIFFLIVRFFSVTHFVKRTSSLQIKHCSAILLDIYTPLVSFSALKNFFQIHSSIIIARCSLNHLETAAPAIKFLESRRKNFPPSAAGTNALGHLEKRKLSEQNPTLRQTERPRTNPKLMKS